MIKQINPNDSDKTGAALPPHIAAAIFELTGIVPDEILAGIIPDAGALEAFHIVMVQIPAAAAESAKFGYSSDLTARWLVGLAVTAYEKLEGRVMPELRLGFDMVFGG